MATRQDFIDYICEQIAGTGNIRYKKMFGEYMVYVNDKPVLLVCDNTVFVKMLSCVEDLMENSSKGFPYKGAKEHYILDIDDAVLAKDVTRILEKNTPLPKPKAKKKTGKVKSSKK
ncbi:MAG: TfoX/Sxy family protein [Endomicrobia bacterium]|nr:TfoX/Sxy family protein [Endomicrobiia bacterium]MCL2506339.1 TfoX/Sxy family protein [Endomicrobiia bacterium]